MECTIERWRNGEQAQIRNLLLERGKMEIEMNVCGQPESLLIRRMGFYHTHAVSAGRRQA